MTAEDRATVRAHVRAWRFNEPGASLEDLARACGWSLRTLQAALAGKGNGRKGTPPPDLASRMPTIAARLGVEVADLLIPPEAPAPTVEMPQRGGAHLSRGEEFAARAYVARWATSRGYSPVDAGVALRSMARRAGAAWPHGFSDVLRGRRSIKAWVKPIAAALRVEPDDLLRAPGEEKDEASEVCATTR